jgi:hypothetical protein
MGKVQYHGGCLCGAVRLEIAAEPFRVGICHCLDCRKHHGTIFHTFAVFPVDAVGITGTTADYRGRHFCPVCGSSLFSRSGDEIEIAVGTFDTPNHVTLPMSSGFVVGRIGFLRSTSHADMSATEKARHAPNHDRTQPNINTKS